MPTQNHNIIRVQDFSKPLEPVFKAYASVVAVRFEPIHPSCLHFLLCKVMASLVVQREDAG